MLLSYIIARIFPIQKEINLEDFFINRFVRVIYNTFFKSYTEKVWGIPCNKISAEWGAQRVKRVSISKAIKHNLRKIFKVHSSSERQKNVETSFIGRFLYPKYGPGQLWEEVARQVQERGGKLHLNTAVRKIYTQGERVTGVEVYEVETGTYQRVEGDYIFSTMPVKELIRGFDSG